MHTSAEGSGKRSKGCISSEKIRTWILAPCCLTQAFSVSFFSTWTRFLSNKFTVYKYANCKNLWLFHKEISTANTTYNQLPLHSYWTLWPSPWNGAVSSFYGQHLQVCDSPVPLWNKESEMTMPTTLPLSPQVSTPRSSFLSLDLRWGGLVPQWRCSARLLATHSLTTICID